MTDPNKVVRDFIYLDTDRLYSLYAQLFEGVSKSIEESFESKKEMSESSPSLSLARERTGESVSEGVLRTELKVLHDEMYNRLEKRIHATEITNDHGEFSVLEPLLRKAPFLKATGPVEIEDYNRATLLMERFNDLGGAIAYAAILESAEQSTRQNQAESQIQGEQNPKVKNSSKDKYADLNHRQRLAREYAKSNGLFQDPEAVKNLKLWTELFGKDGFDISVRPADQAPDLIVRARIDRSWLRLSPEMIRSLYANCSSFPWSIVGQLTYIPNGTLPTMTESKETDSERPSMRDPLHNIFISQMAFERVFLESATRFELIVHPLAIYREYQIPFAE